MTTLGCFTTMFDVWRFRLPPSLLLLPISGRASKKARTSLPSALEGRCNGCKLQLTGTLTLAPLPTTIKTDAFSPSLAHVILDQTGCLPCSSNKVPLCASWIFSCLFAECTASSVQTFQPTCHVSWSSRPGDSPSHPPVRCILFLFSCLSELLPVLVC